MPLPVQLRAVVDEMEFGSDEWRAYINRKTGELASFPAEMMRSVEDEEEDAFECRDWELQQRQDYKRVLDDQDFIELPSKFDIHEYSIMERFCLAQDDDRLRDQLLNAIRGRGAFRYFKDVIHREGIKDHWYGYRDDALKKIAADFLEAEGIPYVDDAQGPAPPP